MPDIAFYTLGCKVNQQETESIKKMFQAAGYTAVSFDEAADVYLINTCTVTQMSDKKSRQAIARAHARNPAAFIVVMGCYAQRAPENVKTLPGVDLVIGTQYRDKLVDWVQQARAAAGVEDIMQARAFEALPTATETERTRVQLKLQDGCDRFCTYCIIPYARGPVRSLPYKEAQAAIGEIARAGAPELVLTGIHLMSYGKDLEEKPPLHALVCYAAAQPGIGRVRLGSLEPKLLNEAFVEALASIETDKLCRQFHLSLQSGSDTVLARMGRKYDTEAYRAAARRLREAFPGCALTTDVIAGFPGETRLEHAETLAFVREMGFARIHVFPYSRREGTRAAVMPGQVRRIEKEGRARELIALGKELERAYLEEQVGKLLLILTEDTKDGWSEGYTDNYARARYPGRKDGLVRLEILSVNDMTLLGKPAGEDAGLSLAYKPKEEDGNGLHFLQNRGWRNSQQEGL